MSIRTSISTRMTSKYPFKNIMAQFALDVCSLLYCNNIRTASNSILLSPPQQFKPLIFFTWLWSLLKRHTITTRIFSYLILVSVSLIIQLNDVIKWFVYSWVNSLSDAQFDVVFNMNLWKGWEVKVFPPTGTLELRDLHLILCPWICNQWIWSFRSWINMIFAAWVQMLTNTC